MTLAVSLNGQPLSRDGVQAMVQAGAISPDQCTISGVDPYGCISGTECSFLVTSRDAFGNAREAMIDTFTASNSNASTLVVNYQGQGIYEVVAMTRHPVVCIICGCVRDLQAVTGLLALPIRLKNENRALDQIFDLNLCHHEVGVVL